MEGLGLGVSGSRVWGLGLRFDGWVRGLKAFKPRALGFSFGHVPRSSSEGTTGSTHSSHRKPEDN